MGWLRDSTEARGLTFKDLAGTLIQVQRGRRRLGQDSVRNMLTRADQGLGEWWLADKRRELRSALAKALGMSVAKLETRLKEPVPSLETEGSDHLELQPFPQLKLDLGSDEPFMPGFPPELTREEGQRIQRAWWVVGDGSDEWIGRWLEARFEWLRVQQPRWSPGKLPRRGRVFLELASTDGMTPQWVEEIPPTLQLCVACPDNAPGKQEPKQPPGRGVPQSGPESGLNPKDTAKDDSSAERNRPESPWTELTFPPTSEWLDELVDWVASKVDSLKPSSREATLRLVHDEYGNAIATPSEVLAFLALIQTVGADAFRCRDRRRLLSDWIKNAEERADGDLIQREGDDLLLSLELERLDAVKATSLSAAEWSSLIPKNFAPPLDRKKTAALLKNKRDKEALAKLEEPEPTEWVAALQRCGVLRPTRDGRLELHPPWLARAVSEMAFDELWESDRLDTLVLNASTSGMAIRRLIDELREGNEARIKRWLTNETTPPVPWLAVCDGMLRAVGFALTIPRVTVSPDIVRRLWDIFECTSQPYDDERPSTPWVSVGGSTGLQSKGAHYLAAAAISAELKRPPSVLQPTAEWIGSDKYGLRRELSHHAFKAMREAVASASPGSDEALAPFRLAEKLLAQDDDRHNVWELVALQQPAMLAQLGKNPRYANALSPAQFDWAAIRDACARHDVSVEAALERAWASCHTWLDRDFFQKRPPSESEVAQLFSVVTGAHLRAADAWYAAQISRLRDAPPRVLLEVPWMSRPEVWRHLQPSVWEYWFETERGLSTAMVEVMPEPFALRLLTWSWSQVWRDIGDKPVMHVLWRRFPQQVASHLVAAISTGKPWRASEMIAYAAPDERCAEIIEKLTSAEDEDLRFWLIDVVSKRRPGWQRAAALLAGDVATARRSPP